MKKDYVVEKFGSCDGKLETLAQSYKTLKNGAIDLDDPGATKLLITEEYVATVRKRNNAVLTYNATLQLLDKAKEDADYYAQQKSKKSDKAIAVDPNHYQYSGFVKRFTICVTCFSKCLATVSAL